MHGERRLSMHDDGNDGRLRFEDQPHPMRGGTPHSPAAMMHAATCLLLAAASSTASAGGVPPSCVGKPNEQPIWDGQPTHVAKSANAAGATTGERLSTGPAGAEIPLLHVSGTAYEMGEAQGKLMAAELKEFMPLIADYLKLSLPAAAIPPVCKSTSTPPLACAAGVVGSPPVHREGAAKRVVRMFCDHILISRDVSDRFPVGTVAKAFAAGGIPACMDQVFNMTHPFIPQYFLDEQRGLAAGSGIDEIDFQRLSMMGELTKMACSMIGAWGPASEGGGLLQLRALDWDTDGPFQAFPLLIVRHPSNPEEGHAYATVGYPGMVGSSKHTLAH